jgi:hypothetical protein
MVHAQYEFKHGKIGTRLMLTKQITVQGEQVQERVQVRLNWIHCLHRPCENAVQGVQVQYEYKHGQARNIARTDHAKTLYKRYKHITHDATVQAQYEHKHGPIGTLRGLAKQTVQGERVQYKYKNIKLGTLPVLA